MKIISGIFVGIYIARYLGPKDYGILSYAIAIVSVFIATSKLGMESILVRELSKTDSKIKKEKYISTVFFLMLISSILGGLIVTTFVSFLEESSYTKLIIYIVSLSVFFQPFLVFDYNFQSLAQGKYSSISKSFALILNSIIKIFLIINQCQLWTIAIAYLFEHVFIALFLGISFKKKSNLFFSYKSFECNLIKPLLKSAGPMILAGLVGLLSVRVDQYMIKNLMSSYDLGLYSAIVKLYEGWIILPTIMTISLFPMLIKLREKDILLYNKRLSNILGTIIWGNVSICIITFLYSSNVIEILYGENYVEAAPVLQIMIFTSIFTGINAVSFRYFSIEKKEKCIMTRVISNLILNIILNSYLIPSYGILGASLSTCFSTLFSSIILDYINYRKNKELIKIKVNSFLYPFLAIKNIHTTIH